MRQLSKLQQIALVVLRTFIGWHFLYEGYYKMMLPGWSRAGEPLKAWSAAGYLKAATGPLSGLFHSMADSRLIGVIDWIVPIGLVLVGLSLMLGALTQIGCWGALAFLALFYLSAIPTSGMPQAGAEGSYLLVSKNLIEWAAVLVLLAFRTGEIAGLDLLWTRRRLAPDAPSRVAAAAFLVAVFGLPGSSHAATPPTPAPLAREAWGAPAVKVSEKDGRWVIAGQKRTVTLDAKTLALTVESGPARWSMVASGPEDMVVRSAGKDATLRLADAPRIEIKPYDPGYKTGVKLALTGWPNTEDLRLYLTVALEGRDEELVFDVSAQEGATVVRRLDWPTALDGSAVDYTVLSNYRGVLLPRAWPKAYHPIRSGRPDRPDTSEIQSDVVECWSMSWWGFQKGPSAMMIIVETSDDAAYQFSHPAGGPTVIGPRWRAQLGRFGYPRTARMAFVDQGNYVDLAKRYRQYAMESGLWVPLKEKIARSPMVEQLIGSIESRMGILTNIVPESLRYNKEDPARNHRLTTFDERAKQLRELKAKGIDRFQIVLTGWHYLGYDRQHPDGLPPAPPAGGYEGMKRLAETARELGYLFTLHDQYRDYYVDAPSYDPQFAAHEEDDKAPTTIFPGTRFGARKEGRLQFHENWDGGKQTYLGPRFMLGHMKKNYGGVLDHGIHPAGSYLDVFGYVPPDEDFHHEHPTTRTEAKREIANLYRWARAHLGIVGTEAGVDWTVPYTDYSSPLGPGRGGIPVPLFNLVYHDAVMVPYSPGGRGGDDDNAGGRPSWLYGMLNGGPPRVGFAQVDAVRDNLKKMTELHKRVALLEMTKHEFLDEAFQKERTTFSDGTTVTVDWTAQTATVAP